MSTVMIIESRLQELLDGGQLSRGSHTEFAPDAACVMEWAAYVTGERHSDSPSCVSPVLRDYAIRLNDRWAEEQRQLLIPYLPRMIGTAGDGLDPARRKIAQRALVTDLLPAWLRLAGMDADADGVVGLAELDVAGLNWALARLRDRAWDARTAAIQQVRAAVKKALTAKPVDAVAAAAAAAAVAAAGGDWWGAGYKAARAVFEKAIAESTAPRLVAVRELAAAQRQVALEVLERMIHPTEASS